MDPKHFYVEEGDNGQQKFKERRDGELLNPKKSGNKYGYVNEKEEWIIEPIFDEVIDFERGVAIVKRGEKYGIIDTKGQIIIDFLYDDLFICDNDVILITKQNRMGIINMKGECLVEPIYDVIWDFTDKVFLIEKNGEKGFIRYDGNGFTDPNFNLESWIEEGFRYGFIEFYDHKNGKYGINNIDGMNLYEAIFDELDPLRQGCIEGYVKIKKDGRWGFLKKDGSYFLLPKYIDKIYPFHEGFAEVKKGDKFGYIKTDGTFLIEPIFDYEENYQEMCWDVFFEKFYFHGFVKGLALVQLNGKYGYLKTDGTYLIYPIFDIADSFFQPAARVLIDDKYGFLKEDGNYLIEPIFEEASHFSLDNIAIVKKNGKYGFITSSGKYLMDPIFEDIDVNARNIFIRTYAKVKINGKWAFLKRDGKYLFEPFMEEIEENRDNFHYFEDGYERVKIDGLWGLVDENGNFSPDRRKN